MQESKLIVNYSSIEGRGNRVLVPEEGWYSVTVDGTYKDGKGEVMVGAGGTNSFSSRIRASGISSYLSGEEVEWHRSFVIDSDYLEVC